MAKKNGDDWRRVVPMERLHTNLVEETIRVLATPASSPDDGAARDRRAADVAERLRLEGQPRLALRVAAAGERRTPELRLEEALAAFAVGEDARVEALIELDGDLKLLMRPMLAAVSGTASRATRTKVKVAAGWFGLANAAAALVRGDLAKHRAALKQVPDRLAAALGSRELRALGSLVSGRGPDIVPALEILAKSPFVRGSVELARAFGALLAARAPGALFGSQSATTRERVGDAAWRMIMADALGALLDGGERGRVAAVIAASGSAMFPEAERARAAIYEGFGLIGHDVKRARAAFDRAVELGGDMVEALRGRLLLELGSRAEPSPSDAAKCAHAALRLAKIVERDPDGTPIAAVLALAAAGRFIDADEPERAWDACQAARARAAASGFLRDPFLIDVELCEAMASAPVDAEAILDRVLERDPKNRIAWEGKVSLAVVRGDGSHAALASKAAALLGDPSFGGAARRDGEPGPIVPGATGPGELARHVERRLSISPAPYDDPDVAAARAALAPDDRAALDAAVLSILIRGKREASAEAWLARACSEASLSDRHLEALFVVALYEVTTLDLLSVFFGAIESRPPSFGLALLALALADAEPVLATRILSIIANRLPGAELRARRREIGRSRAPSSQSSKVELLIDRIDDRLLPHFAIGEDLDDDDVPTSPLEQLLGPAGPLANVKPKQLEPHLPELESILRAGPSQKNAIRLVELLGRIAGGSP